MHPPRFLIDHRLSEWPECRLEMRCSACRRASYVPIAMLRAERGDRTFREILAALRCGLCGTRAAPVYLLAGEHRVHCWGAAPDWAIELAPDRM